MQFGNCLPAGCPSPSDDAVYKTSARRAAGRLPLQFIKSQEPKPIYKPVTAGKRKLEGGHFSQPNCISPESPGRRLIEDIEFFFLPLGLWNGLISGFLTH
jgi:hypothetical protein